MAMWRWVCGVDPGACERCAYPRVAHTPQSCIRRFGEMYQRQRGLALDVVLRAHEHGVLHLEYTSVG